MNVIQGDLLRLAVAGEFDVIMHGCNCQNTMGAGIAKSIRRKFPAAYEADQRTAKGDRDKLGTISTATVDCDGHQLTIVNAYTQFHWRGRGLKADYEAIRSAFRAVKAGYSGKRIGYPRIGGDWTVIAPIIQEELASEHHTLVEYSG